MERLTDKRLAIPPGQWQEVTQEEARELKEIPAPSMRELYYRLSQIEDILCDDTDEYDLDRLSVLCNQRMSMREEVSERFGLTAKIPLDRLRELVEADKTLREFAEDVAVMMALLKIARIGTGTATDDSWIDLAGYAACGGEIAAKGRKHG